MKRSTIILVLAVLLAVAASFLFGGYLGRKSAESVPGRPDTLYVEHWVHDTIKEYVSKPVEVRYVYLPVHDSVPYPVHDTTNVVDSVLVEVPIEEKTYVGNDYRAVVRGFQPELVDIYIRQKERIITVPYQKRWTFTVGPQAGVGITPKGFQPYAGAGITFGYSF